MIEQGEVNDRGAIIATARKWGFILPTTAVLKARGRWVECSQCEGAGGWNGVEDWRECRECNEAGGFAMTYRRARKVQRVAA